MATKYVVRCTIEVNGQSITDFKGVTESEITVGKVVPLMHKTGSAKLTKRFGFIVDYVVPQIGSMDWSDVTDATASIIYDSGDRVDFGGVDVISVGESAVDGENEVVQRITFMAASRNGDVE